MDNDDMAKLQNHNKLLRTKVEELECWIEELTF